MALFVSCFSLASLNWCVLEYLIRQVLRVNRSIYDPTVDQIVHFKNWSTASICIILNESCYLKCTEIPVSLS